jgi:hypothetical protein
MEDPGGASLYGTRQLMLSVLSMGAPEGDAAASVICSLPSGLIRTSGRVTPRTRVHL